MKTGDAELIVADPSPPGLLLEGGSSGHFFSRVTCDMFFLFLRRVYRRAAPPSPYPPLDTLPHPPLQAEELHATQMQLGLSLGFSALLEFPLFFFSHAIASHIGLLVCLLSATGARGLRALGYALAPTEWGVIPFDLLNGVSFVLVFQATLHFGEEQAITGGQMSTISKITGLRTLGLLIGMSTIGPLLEFLFGHHAVFLFSVGSSTLIVALAVCCHNAHWRKAVVAMH